MNWSSLLGFYFLFTTIDFRKCLVSYQNPGWHVVARQISELGDHSEWHFKLTLLKMYIFTPHWRCFQSNGLLAGCVYKLQYLSVCVGLSFSMFVPLLLGANKRQLQN